MTQSLSRELETLIGLKRDRAEARLAAARQQLRAKQEELNSERLGQACQAVPFDGLLLALQNGLEIMSVQKIRLLEEQVSLCHAIVSAAEMDLKEAILSLAMMEP